MFRQFRDTRFSKDKSPLKDNVGGVMSLDGNKGTAGPLLYLHLATADSFVAAGFYKLGSGALLGFRKRLVDHERDVDAMLKQLEAAGLALERSDALKRMPRGFEGYEDHRHADLLRLKSFIVRRPLTQSDWKSGAVVRHVVQLATQSRLLLRF